MYSKITTGCNGETAGFALLKDDTVACILLCKNCIRAFDPRPTKSLVFRFVD